MAKKKLTYGTDEEMEKIDPGEELMLDLTAGTQAQPDNIAERIEYLKEHLWHALGTISQLYPRWDEWEQERVDDLRNAIAWSWHYRQEIRLLTQLGRDEFDVSDHLMEWSLVSDQEFGPLPQKEALLN